MAAALARKEASPVQSSLVQCSPVQCSTVEASTVQSSAVQYSAMQHCITIKSMVRIPTGRHHRRHLYQRGHRQPRRRGGRFARDMRHTVAPIVVRLHRLGAVAGAGAGARVRAGCREAARCHGSDAGCCDVPKNAMRSAAMGLHIEARSPGSSQGSRTTDTQAAPTKSHLHRLGWGWGLGLGLGLVIE